ncbi:MAG TPA: hypothetical protein VNH15_06590 [Elusimicrobiota bacterium]|nr:hypothetical protein [Elusimicrobiota bacterium]
MKTWLGCVASLLIAAAPALAQNSASGDGDFVQGLSAVSVSPGVAQAARRMKVNVKAEAYAADLRKLLGWYGRADAETGLDPAAMSRVVVQGLKKGTYDGVIFGESHGNKTEQAAAHLIIGNILASGVRVGDFMSEATDVQGGKPVGLYSAAQFARAGVPAGLFVNQFNPEPDVARGLKAAGAGLLITYTGSAHTCPKMRDLIYQTFNESDLHWEKYFPGRPTVAQSFARHHKRPIIMAMVEESDPLDWIEYLLLQDAFKGVGLAEFHDNLQALEKGWSDVTGSFAARQGEGFIQAPGQPNLYLGIAPTDRRPLALEALDRATADPAFAAWLGDQKIQNLSLEPQTRCDAAGACRTSYQIYVYSGAEQSLPACAYGPVKDKDGAVTKQCFSSSADGISGQYGDIFARAVPASVLP